MKRVESGLFDNDRLGGCHRVSSAWVAVWSRKHGYSGDKRQTMPLSLSRIASTRTRCSLKKHREKIQRRTTPQTLLQNRSFGGTGSRRGRSPGSQCAICQGWMSGDKLLFNLIVKAERPCARRHLPLPRHPMCLLRTRCMKRVYAKIMHVKHHSMCKIHCTCCIYIVWRRCR